MIVTVKHIQNEQEFVLLDTSYNSKMSITGGVLFGFNSHWSAESKICVCDRSGLIKWLDASEVKVNRIDGKALHEYLYPHASE